ncbi:MAG: hypothetical protein R2682_00855 [Pyrinomonadaceae bacterium]
MKRIITVVTTISAVGVGALLISDRTRADHPEPIFEVGFNSCRNITFRVANNRKVAIVVKKIKYYNASQGRWETEEIDDRNGRCERGATCTIDHDGRDLAAREGDRLTQIVFIYRDSNSYKTRESQEFLPSDPPCRANKIYGHAQSWTIDD